MDWKLGTAMSSSSCKSFNCPYVTLQMRVAESDGTIKQHTLEMTIPQFQVHFVLQYMHESLYVTWQSFKSPSSTFFFLQNFSAQLKEMANTLDTAA